MKRTTPRSTRTDTLFPYTTPLRSHQVQERLACRQRGARARHGDGKIDFRIGGQHVACLRFGPASRGERLCNGFSRLPAHQCFRSEEHTSELQSLMRISYAVFCLKKKKQPYTIRSNNIKTKYT